MKLRFLSASIVALILASGAAMATANTDSELYRQAVRLYESGMYERALSLFETASDGDDPMADGYALLCREQLKTQGYEDALKTFSLKYGKTPLDSQIHLRYAENLFDEQRYAEALPEFAQVPQKELSRSQYTELLFKEGYCDFALGNYAGSKPKFEQVVARPSSDYTAPATYALGYIAYEDKDFAEAYKRFESSSKDPRFDLQSRYYMLECRFMLGDYSYVTEQGEALYAEVPVERKSHLSRIISESFLIQGDTEKAKEYYDDTAATGGTAMTRADWFYAGSLQYALGEWQQAIDNYSKMGALGDSIGQIAAYQTGYSCIKTKNKVAAMDAFQQAVQDYDLKIREDALFNYAKLAFDLNHDPSGFKSYLAQYKSSGRNDMIYDYIAVANLFNHDYAAAIEAYDNIEDLTPEMKSNYMKANFLRGEQLISNGSYRDAVASLRAATFFTSRQDNFNKLSRYWLAESYYKTDNFQEAAEIYTDLYNISALENQQEGKLLTYNAAYSYFNAGDWASAANWFDKYLSGSDTSVRQDAMTRRADCDFYRKDYKTAIESYAGVLSEYPSADNIYPYYQQGLAYGLAGKKNEKVAALSKVKAADPSSQYYAECMYELGRSYIAVKKEGEAVNCFKTIVSDSDNSSYVAKSLIELGMIARNKSQYDKALTYYKQVAEDYAGTEDAENALLAIESIYQSKGEPEKYIAYTESLGQPRKTEAEKELIYFGSAEQLYLSGEYDKAISALDKYLTSYPGGTKVDDANFYMADSYRCTGRKEKACDYYEKVINGAPEGSFREQSLLNYANLSYGLEHYPDAYKAYSQLADVTGLDDNRKTAAVGMMRSAYFGRDYSSAIDAAAGVKSLPKVSSELGREADYIKAKSCLATSQRDQAYEIFKSLAANPSTSEGAEAAYLVIQDLYDQGSFDDVEKAVYKFADASGNQSYWLAKAFIVLGDSFVEKGNTAQAKATFESILSGYEPQSGISDDVTDGVKMRLEKLSQISD